MVRHYLDFEKPLMELEREYEELQRFAPRSDPRVSSRMERLEKRIAKVKEETYSQLTAWQRTQLSRPSRLTSFRMSASGRTPVPVRSTWWMSSSG